MLRSPLPLTVTLLALSGHAHALGRLADVEVIDRATGTSLEAHYCRGEYWIAGVPGGRYSIAIRNRLGERLLAVTSVDGVNVVSGETAAWQQLGYVFFPHQSYEIPGWRKSDREVADFVFTPSPGSYAERTGRPASVGIIGVALFRERARETPVPAVADAPARPSAAPAPEDSGALRREAKASDAAAAGASRSLAESADALKKLGTGHGEREYSSVDHTSFDRQSDTPAEVIRIRYDSYENLVAMGVVRPRWAVPARPDPFPASPGVQYVPDPPVGLR